MNYTIKCLEDIVAEYICSVNIFLILFLLHELNELDIIGVCTKFKANVCEYNLLFHNFLQFTEQTTGKLKLRIYQCLQMTL